MAKLTRPALDIVLPGRFTQFKAKLWSLAGEEELIAKDRAHDAIEVRYKGKDLAVRLAGNPELLDMFYVSERLSIALRRFNDPSKPLFSGAEVLRFFTDRERGNLNESLENYIIESNPLTFARSSEEVFKLLEDHASGEAAALSALVTSCDEPTARSIASALVVWWAEQRNANSSTK